MRAEGKRAEGKLRVQMGKLEEVAVKEQVRACVCVRTCVRVPTTHVAFHAPQTALEAAQGRIATLSGLAKEMARRQEALKGAGAAVTLRCALLVIKFVNYCNKRTREETARWQARLQASTRVACPFVRACAGGGRSLATRRAGQRRAGGGGGQLATRAAPGRADQGEAVGEHAGAASRVRPCVRAQP